MDGGRGFQIRLRKLADPHSLLLLARQRSGQHLLPVGLRQDAIRLLHPSRAGPRPGASGALELRIPFALRGYHGDSVDGAGRDAQPAADAPGLDYGVHELRRADDRIDWAGVYAERAADAAALVDQGNRGAFHALMYPIFAARNMPTRIRPPDSGRGR